MARNQMKSRTINQSNCYSFITLQLVTGANDYLFVHLISEAITRSCFFFPPYPLRDNEKYGIHATKLALE
jgi:hypothetical protein